MLKKSPLKSGPMLGFHLDEVLTLEAQILQFGRNPEDKDTKKQLLRSFLAHAMQGRALAEIFEDEQNRILGYYVLLLEPNLIQRFYYLPEIQLKQVSYLAQIAVHPAFHGQGIGHSLMQEIEKNSRLAGKTRLILEVNSEARALHWYQKQGFDILASQIFLQKPL